MSNWNTPRTNSFSTIALLPVKLNATVRKFVLSVAISTCLIAGCSLPGRQQVSAKQTYWLHNSHEYSLADTAISKPCLMLRVNAPRAAPGFLSPRMAYTKQPGRLDYYAYHMWVDTPARMLATLIESHVDQTGMFGAVISGSADIRADLRLDSEVINLVQEFDSQGSQVLLEIKIHLIEISNRSLLNSQTFSYIEKSSADNPEAGVASANRAVDRFTEDLTVFLAEFVATFSCPDTK